MQHHLAHFFGKFMWEYYGQLEKNIIGSKSIDLNFQVQYYPYILEDIQLKVKIRLGTKNLIMTEQHYWCSHIAKAFVATCQKSWSFVFFSEEKLITSDLSRGTTHANAMWTKLTQPQSWVSYFALINFKSRSYYYQRNIVLWKIFGFFILSSSPDQSKLIFHLHGSLCID